jgi:hypothetical protein
LLIADISQQGGKRLLRLKQSEMVLDLLPRFLGSAKLGIESREKHFGVNKPWLAFQGFEGIESPFQERFRDLMTPPKPSELPLRPNVLRERNDVHVVSEPTQYSPEHLEGRTDLLVADSVVGLQSLEG